jgi:hypothetical protein
MNCRAGSGSCYPLKVATLAPMRDSVHAAHPAGAPLLWAFPNPAKGEVRLSYRVAEPVPVRVAIYDGLGREVVRVADEGYRETGLYTKDFIGDHLPSGIYYVRMVTRGAAAMERFVVAR